MKLDKQKKGRILQKIIIGIVALATVFVFDFWLFMPKNLPATPVEETGGEEKNVLATTEENDVAGGFNNFNSTNAVKPEIDLIDESAQVLGVPFTVQAPSADWDDLHNEACEEAAIIMAKHWLAGEDLNQEKAEEEIQDLVKWQTENWGGHYDLSVKKTIELAQQYFKIEKIYFTQVRDGDDIKKELSEGNLVIVPTAGRLLKNPYYKQPGPPYHMVVVKGYEKNEFITNDPGTKRGEDLVYEEDVLLAAIHDWPLGLGEGHELENNEKAVEVLKGDKIMIVVEK